MMKIISYFKNNKSINTNFDNNSLTLYMPIILCGGFFLLTILLFIFGPIDWKIDNNLSLYSFLSASFLALILGYVSAIRKKINHVNSYIDLNKIIYIAFFINIVVFFANIYLTTGKFFPDIINSITNSGDAYNQAKNSTSNIIIYIGMLMGPFTAYIVPITFIYFKNLSLKAKILGIITVILNLMAGIETGTINSYASTILQLSIMLIIYFFANFKVSKTREKIWIIIVLFILSSSFLLFYKNIMAKRLTFDANKSPDIKEEVPHDNITPHKNVLDEMFKGSAKFSTGEIKENSLFLKLPSSSIHFVSYITHGYKGLSLALKHGYTSSYGLGFSDFFRHNVLKVIGQSEYENILYERTYMKKIENDGWKTGEVWSTFFIFPASDIGFILTPFVIYLIGYFFAKSWKDTIINQNIFSSVVFFNMIILICFFSMNNIMFQTGGNFIVMVSMLLFWFISKKVGRKI